MQMNNSLKYAIFPLVLVLFLSLVAFAQDTTQNPPPQNPPAGMRHMADPATRLQHMAQYLNLTDDQKAKIQPILQNEAEQLKAIRSDTSLTADQRHAKVQEIRKASRAQIEPILTPDQVAKLKASMKEAAHHRGMRHGGMNAGGPLAWMSENLNLTDDQKSKIQPLFTNQRTQVQAIRQDASLTDEQKHTKIAELRKSTHQQLMAILTPEQQQLMQQHMREHRGKGPGPDAPSSAPPADQSAPPQSI